MSRRNVLKLWGCDMGSNAGNNEGLKGPQKDVSSLREAMLEQLIGDIDELLDKVDTLTDKAQTTFSREVKGGIEALGETAREMVALVASERKASQREREQWTIQIKSSLERVENLVGGVPPVLKRQWWQGFFIGFLGAGFIAVVAMAAWVIL